MLSEVQTDAPDLTTPPSAKKLSFQTEMGRISRQSGMAFAGTIVAAALGYVFKVYLARVLGAEALGIYALGITIISFLGLLNTLGLPESTVRFVPLYAASKKFAALGSLLWNGTWVLLATNLIFVVVLLHAGPWISVHFYHSPQLVRYLPLFGLMMVMGALNTFFSKILGGYKEIGLRTLITKFIGSPLVMVLAVPLIALGTGLWGYLVAQVAGTVVVLALLLTLVWQRTPIEARAINIRKLWIEADVWTFSAAMFGVGMMEFFMLQADRIALGFYRGVAEVGVYTVAVAVIAYEPVILQSVNQIFAPVISDVHARGEFVLLGRLFQTLTKWMLGLTLPLALAVIIYARSVMRIFGPDFEAAWPVLVIGTCGQLVNCGVGSVGYMLLMSGNQRRLVRVQTAMTILMVLLSIELVPRWGVVGAAIAAAVTNAGSNVWSLFQVRAALHLSPYNGSYLKLLPSVAAAFLAIMFCRKSAPVVHPDWIVIGISLLCAYGAFLMTALAMGLDADDRLIANAVWGRVRGGLSR